MDIRYDENARMLYIRVGRGPVLDSEEVRPGLVIDYNESNELVGFEIDLAHHKQIDMSSILLEGALHSRTT